MPRGVPAKKPEEVNTSELTPNEQMFLQLIRDFFPSLHLHSDKMLTTKIGRDKLADVSLELQGFIEHGAGILIKNEYLALGIQLLSCLSKWVQYNNIPFTLTTMLSNFGSLQMAVNSSFPGYLDAKLLKYLIMSHPKVKTK